MSEAPHSPPPGVFRNRSYRSLFAAAAISNYGSMLHAMALPFVAISVLDATPADIATLTAAGLAPGFVLGLVASAWVDRLPRRPILVASDWARAATLLWIPVAAWLELLTLGQLHVVVAIHGFLTFLFGAAHHAILPAIVPSTQLLEANGRLKAVESVTEGGAFASGGVLIQWLGAPFVFIVDAASYVLSALCLRGVDAQEVPRTASVGTSTSVWQETREGVAFLVGHRLLLPGSSAWHWWPCRGASPASCTYSTSTKSWASHRAFWGWSSRPVASPPSSAPWPRKGSRDGSVLAGA
ncbi:MAG: MFS transporter [Deltaproteobacteria bacterium]|nr:MFS transporter [Deltaproteobacteria bacterium]